MLWEEHIVHILILHLWHKHANLFVSTGSSTSEVPVGTSLLNGNSMNDLHR